MLVPPFCHDNGLNIVSFSQPLYFNVYTIQTPYTPNQYEALLIVHTLHEGKIPSHGGVASLSTSDPIFPCQQSH